MNDTANPVHIDTRAVLRVYAGAAIVFGVALAAFRPQWFLVYLGDSQSALTRVSAAVIVAAGCFALALARVEEPDSRRQGLLWLAIGHGVVALSVLTLQDPTWNSTWSAAVWIVLATPALLFFYGWQFGEGADGRLSTMVSLFGSQRESAGTRLRSEYERRIRQAAAQEERNRLARDLHDSIKQQLFAIHTAAATAQERFDGEPAGARESIDLIRDSARAAMTEMDAMLQGLRAAPLENVGLVEALKEAAEALAFRTGARVAFTPGDLPSSETLPPGTQEAVFRVAQEALANIARHARASHVEVRLAGTEDDVVLTVQDDGAGFDQRQPARGLVLANMRERAAECGGRIELLSQPGGGTRVRLTIGVTRWDPAEATRYAWSAAIYAIWAIVFFLLHLMFLHHDMLAFSAPVMILIMAQCAHELLAWRRTRKPPGAGR